MFSCKIFFIDGGQNPLEPATKCRIFHGPKISNFKEIYKYLNKQKIAIKVLMKIVYIIFLIKCQVHTIVSIKKIIKKKRLGIKFQK